MKNLLINKYSVLPCFSCSKQIKMSERDGGDDEWHTHCVWCVECQKNKGVLNHTGYLFRIYDVAKIWNRDQARKRIR